MKNDDLTITSAVREQRDAIPMTTPVEQIISRGRAVRARRRIPGVAGGLAVAAAVALGVTALVPSSHQASHPGSAQLTAWTVTKTSGDTIRVTVRELRDPAGLQGKLRADGLPVNVSFSGPPLNQVCQPLNVPRATLRAVAHVQGHGRSGELVFHVSAIPAGDGVSLFINQNPPAQPGYVLPVGIAVGLVHASPRCTGS
jgi:hypothetical protein